MSSAHRKSNESPARDQAAMWITMLERSEEMPSSELERFHVWCEEPRNARALSEYRTLLSMIQDLPEPKAASLRALPIHQPRFPALEQLFANPWRFSAVAAAAVVVALAGTWFGFRPVREYVSQTYTTDTGESRSIVLKDGSLAVLNTGSRIRWIGSGKDRHVALDRGEVLFHVAHDSTRPFRVTVGNSEIRDLATEFDVYRKSNGSVVVTVLSGQVAVKELVAGGASAAWPERQLKPNEQLEYTSAKLIADVHPVDAPKAVLWREGLLVTEGQSFATIVGELGRYSSKQILIADPHIYAADINIGGTLGIHDVPAALDRIQKLAPIVVTDTDGAYILTYKADHP
jgi:transmembrane sensor